MKAGRFRMCSEEIHTMADRKERKDRCAQSGVVPSYVARVRWHAFRSSAGWAVSAQTPGLSCRRPKKKKNSGTQQREEGWYMVDDKKEHVVLREMKCRDPFMNPNVPTRNKKK